jgi:heme/copper-type cytochrome/quinol oxidase subunit 4
MLATLLRNRISAVWFVLIAATLISFALGTGHGISSHHVASIAILLVAFIKVFLVGMYFMELRDAPDVLRGLFAGYCLLVFSVTSGMFLFA